MAPSGEWDANQCKLLSHSLETWTATIMSISVESENDSFYFSALSADRR